MKGKNLTRRMKEFITDRKLKPEEWLYVENSPKTFTIMHKQNNEKRSFSKADYAGIYF